MAKELRLQYLSGKTVSAHVIKVSDNSSTTVALTEVGTTGRYVGDMPTSTYGHYDVVYFEGVTPLGSATMYWTGTQEVQPASIMSWSGTDEVPGIDENGMVSADVGAWNGTPVGDLVSGLNAEQDIKLTAIYTATSTGAITIVSPLSADGHITLVRGDSYTGGRALVFTASDLSFNLATSTVVLSARDKATGELLWDKIAASATTSTSVSFVLTSARTKLLRPCERGVLFDVQATTSGGDIITLVRGDLTVLDEVTR